MGMGWVCPTSLQQRKLPGLKFAFGFNFVPIFASRFLFPFVIQERFFPVFLKSVDQSEWNERKGETVWVFYKEDSAEQNLSLITFRRFSWLHERNHSKQKNILISSLSSLLIFRMSSTTTRKAHHNSMQVEETFKSRKRVAQRWNSRTRTTQWKHGSMRFFIR